MSLSKAILFETPARVVALIESGANVNEQDPYGLTPLIEATLKQDLGIAQALLAHGARVDQQDVAGQTALQWAVNRSQKDFCEVFLKAGANPNHHAADGQPILVYPFLRGQADLQQLLMDYGAKLQVTHDFIEAKLIGHRYELKGRAIILNARNRFLNLDLEGFYLEFTVGLILKSLNDFSNSPVGARFSAYAPVLLQVQKALRAAAALIPVKYLKTRAGVEESKMRETLAQPLVLIPVSYEGHAISFVRYGHYLAKCDRGVKHIVDTVVIQQVGKPALLNPDFLKDLMLNKKNKDYIQNTLKKMLQLETVCSLPARYQLSGNCSWANIEAAVPAMMFLLMFRGNWKALGEVAALKKSVMEFYDAWIAWDQNRALDRCISEFYASDPKRRASLASLLAAILFQRCRPNRPAEVERARKILAILQRPECAYILKSYLRVYHSQVAGETGENFVALLKVCGLNLADFGAIR